MITWDFDFPDKWAHTLELIQKRYPNAMIVGGALRDIIYAKEIKDVDIFIEVGEEPSHEDLRILEILIGAELYPSSNEETVKYADSLRNTIFEIYDFQLDEQQYQIVFIRKGARPQIEDFDLSFCQISWDGKTISMSEAFAETYKTKIVTLGRHNEWEIERLKSRIERFSEKFPQLTFPKAPEPIHEELILNDL